MNYKGIVEVWIKEKTDQGASRRNAYKIVGLNIQELHQAHRELKMKSLRGKKLAQRKLKFGKGKYERFDEQAAITKLRTYINNERRYGHVYFHGDILYFRPSWMSPTLKKQIESAGIIRRVGNKTELEEIGVHVPQYEDNRAVYYEVDQRLL